jgi:mannosyltransferase
MVSFWNKSIYRNKLSLGLILALALGLRLINLGSQPFTPDEILSLDITNQYHSIRDLLGYLGTVEFHPPLYYILLHYWIPLFGQTIFSLKMLSVIFGLASVVLVYVLSKKLFRSEKIALIAALISTILPLFLEMDQTARPYSVFNFFALVCMLTLWNYYDSRRKRYLILYATSAVIGLYLHYSFLVVICATGSWGLFNIMRDKTNSRSREFILWLISHSAILLVFGFWLKNLLYKITLSNMLIYGLSSGSFFQNRASDFFGFLFNQLIWLYKSVDIPQINILLMFIAEIALIIISLVAFSDLISKSTSQNNNKNILFLVWMIVAPSLIFLFLPYSVDYSNTYIKHMIFVAIPIIILIAWTLSQVKIKIAAVTFGIFTISLTPSIMGILGGGKGEGEYQFGYEAQFISQNYMPGDLVIIEYAYSRSDFTHFMKDGIPVIPLLPLNYFDEDYGGSRHTLGIIENEGRSRYNNYATPRSPVRSKVYPRNDR